MERTEYETLANTETAHWWFRGMRALTAALLDPLYEAKRDRRILDAGCGTGGNVRFLQRYGSVVGLDQAPESFEFWPPHHRYGHLVRGSVLYLPFPDEQFDLVTSFDVLYHRGVPDELEALGEMHRVLRPGGRVLIRLPAYEFLRSKHDRAVHTRRRYTISQVRELLHEAGFFIEYCSYVNSLLFPLALAQRMFERAIPALEQQQSDLTLLPPLLNGLLQWPLELEATWVGLRKTLPAGLSILCLAHCGKLERVVVRGAQR
ncbi:MAG: class I SAM-dependent methyltransferase [Chloroflexaceae bacterium]|nr:class I SAM-dependent methyltransferase [Chloroflexaceae bacterium]